MAVGYRLDDWGSIPGKGKRFFLLSAMSRPMLELTQPSV
jgi:hypothetical protein